MFKSRLTFKRIFAVLTLIGSLVWLAAFSFPDNRLHLVFCDVGQGDATLITQGFNQILIDGGPNDKVLTCLKNNMPFFDKTIEIVALTHPEADHMTGIIPVIEKYRIDYFLAGPEGNNSAVYAELIKRINQPLKTKPLILNPYSGQKIKLGSIILDTLWPTREFVAERINNTEISNGTMKQWNNERGAILGAKATDAHLNDYSLVFLLTFLTYNGKKVLLMGDADSRVQGEIVKAESGELSAISGIDILKFPHHGSKTGIREDFLERIKPGEAVISVGKNSYGHPSSEALDLLSKFSVTVRRTDIEGEIKYVF